MRRRVVVILGIVTLTGWSAWDPGPSGTGRFDRGRNGIWLPHACYAGGGGEVAAVAARLRDRGFRDLYVHAGPLRDDGTIADPPGPALRALREAFPEARLFAWLGARLDRVPLEDPSWRARVVDTVATLEGSGFDGVHFDLEPVPDGSAAYLLLLEEVGTATRGLVGQAIPRRGPFGWSGPYTEATMARADQTVLMAYDTLSPSRKLYVAFVRWQAERLLRSANRVGRGEVTIGVPTYEDNRPISNPEVENLATACAGVRAALEREPSLSFAGVAVYAYWVTDASEWDAYDRSWRSP